MNNPEESRKTDIVSSGKSLKHRTLRATLWNLFDRGGSKVAMFLIILIMARQLGPELFGLVAIVMIFIDISNDIVNFGFSQALIRKGNPSVEECNSVLLFNITTAIILDIILTIFSNSIAHFFDQPVLGKIIPWLGLVIIFDSTTVVQRSILSASIDFRTQTRASLLAVTIAGSVALVMTFSGFGIGALVALQVIRSALEAIFLWIFCRWLPSLRFSGKAFSSMVRFSFPLVLSGLIDSFYTNGVAMLIGKFFNARDLAYFSRAKQFATFPSAFLSNAVGKVSYPALCTISDKPKQLASTYRGFLSLSVALVFPMMMTLGALAFPTIRFLLGQDWIFSAPLLMILAPTFMWYPVHAINLNLLVVAGKSNLFLKVEILKKITGIVLILFFFRFGIGYIAVAMLISTLIALVYNTFYTGQLIEFGLFAQLKEFFPTLIISMITAGIVFLLTLLDIPDWLMLIIGLPLSLIIYTSGVKIFQPQMWYRIKDVITIL